MMELHDWALVDAPDPYRAPEARRLHIKGNVFGSMTFKDGASITTSPVVEFVYADFSLQPTPSPSIRAWTQTGHVYELVGEAAPDYELLFPGARERLIKHIQELKEKKDGN